MIECAGHTVGIQNTASRGSQLTVHRSAITDTVHRSPYTERGGVWGHMCKNMAPEYLRDDLCPVYADFHGPRHHMAYTLRACCVTTLAPHMGLHIACNGKMCDISRPYTCDPCRRRARASDDVKPERTARHDQSCPESTPVDRVAEHVSRRWR